MAELESISELGPTEPSDYEIKNTAKNAVRLNLDFPEEADFPWFVTNVIKDEYHTWIVVGEVVGKNAFGMRTRFSYICKVSKDSYGLSAELLDMSEIKTR